MSYKLKFGLSIVATFAAALMTSGTSLAAAYTYDFIAPITNLINGSVTIQTALPLTPGETITLSQPDITSWTTCPTCTPFPLDQSNSTLLLDATGGALTATSTGLFFNFSEPIHSQLEFSSGSAFGSVLYVQDFCDAGSLCIDGQRSELIVYSSLVGLPGQTMRFSGNVQIGTATPVPEPATPALFATGLGALGLLGWRRKRKAQAVP